MELSQTYNKEEVALLKLLKELENKKRKNYTEQKKKFIKLRKAKIIILKKAEKKKKKRKSGTAGGFRKNKPVPAALITYLGLDEGIELARSDIVRLLHKKFKMQKLSKGHITTLNEEAAGILGGKKGQKIHMLHDFQKFVKQIYEAN